MTPTELKKWRINKADVLQKEAAEMFGVSICKYRMWESGKGKIDEVAKLAFKWLESQYQGDQKTETKDI